MIYNNFDEYIKAVIKKSAKECEMSVEDYLLDLIQTLEFDRFYEIVKEKAEKFGMELYEHY